MGHYIYIYILALPLELVIIIQKNVTFSKKKIKLLEDQWKTSWKWRFQEEKTFLFIDECTSHENGYLYKES